jgi:hypothetical protein
MSAIKLFKKEQPGKNESSQPADLAAACLGGNFLASSAGEAYDVRTRSPNRECRLNSAGKGKTMLRTIAIILLVLVQPEMERWRFPLVKIPPYQGGDLQGMRVYRPMPVSGWSAREDQLPR